MVWFAAFIVLLVFLVWAFMPRRKIVKYGGFAHLPSQFDCLINGAPKVHGLVVKVVGTSDFIQFSRFRDHIQVDFPLVTDRQKSLRNKYQKEVEALGYSVDISEGDDGASFLDFDAIADPGKLSDLCATLLKNTFGLTGSERLKMVLVL